MAEVLQISRPGCAPRSTPAKIAEHGKSSAVVVFIGDVAVDIQFVAGIHIHAE